MIWNNTQYKVKVGSSLTDSETDSYNSVSLFTWNSVSSTFTFRNALEILLDYVCEASSLVLDHGFPLILFQIVFLVNRTIKTIMAVIVAYENQEIRLESNGLLMSPSRSQHQRFRLRNLNFL